MFSHNILPLFRWAGSKKKLLSELHPFWLQSKAKRYIEPFVGSAQLFFKIKPQEAILGDVNQNLINAYKTLQSNPHELFDILNRLKRDKATYYQIRSNGLNLQNPIENAAHFIYLNKLCFNGLYRTNLRGGEFNVPFSATAGAHFPSEEELIQYSQFLSDVSFICGDFETIVRNNARKGDFVYLDPPYAIANKKIFAQYGPNTFGYNDINRLILLLQDLDCQGVHFLLSYAYDDEIKDLLSAWPIKIVSAQRNIAGFCHKRRLASEMIISNI